MGRILSQTPYRDTDDTVSRIMKMVRGPHGELSLDVRTTVEDIVRNVNQRDKASQVAAIYYWFKSRFTYLYDPIQNELIKTPARLVQEIRTKGKCCGDCDDATGFFLAAFRSIGIRCQPVRVSFNKTGDYSHIFTIAIDQMGRKLIVDPVSSHKTPQMLGDARQLKVGE